MGEARAAAWRRELEAVHRRLRDAIGVARAAIDRGGDAGPPSRDLLLYCHGFCQALTGHHRGEDTALFPLLVAADPALAPVVSQLKQDHSMLDHLIGALEKALDRGADPEELHRHLDGIEAVMETHFGYEERRLGPALDALDAGDLDRTDLLGPLA
ncbi:hemerythrin domain-containing protein [Nocardiopsis flavescens]|uniref:Hemerythrin HHE cation binding domain-containing protein n=1 Tax=Nocardiopsis flavescens TaxID=758803 RepID=A0A1M6J8J4_9ACTN|nr:hemerythrin domain-containing protein [Nocardiopsis flavescens]SHJ43018.1 Hemerythrin HHE cation binding domain-containing protein [Nocardiopsis flavescens]